MPVKIGRNEKCWCGSDKKYKHCHYGRESEKKVSKGEIIQNSNKIGLRKGCYVPEELKHECSGKIINAHTVSKSNSLKEIADSKNHVLGIKFDMAKIFSNNGKIVLERIGINKASTFKGFCSVHDKKVFSIIEDHPFSYNEKQCFVLAYRALAKELYAKEGSIISTENLKNLDKGQSLATQFFIQDIARKNETGASCALNELNVLKDFFDNELTGKTKDTFSHLVIVFDSKLPIAVSSIFAPIADFDGKEIQNLADLSIPAQQLIINSFSSEGKGYALFSWQKGSDKILEFTDSFIKINDNDKFSALVRLFIGHAENCFYSPDWWNSLSEKQKNKVEYLVMEGVNPFTYDPLKTLIDDGIHFPGGHYQETVQLNF